MSTTPPAMADALAKLWARFLPEITQRIALLESASASLSAGVLPDDQREAAHGAAHKLAGTLGTFGLPRGTELARSAENLLAATTAAELTPQFSVQLSLWTAELRLIVSSRT